MLRVLVLSFVMVSWKSTFADDSVPTKPSPSCEIARIIELIDQQEIRLRELERQAKSPSVTIVPKCPIAQYQFNLPGYIPGILSCSVAPDGPKPLNCDTPAEAEPLKFKMPAEPERNNFNGIRPTHDYYIPASESKRLNATS